jgi:hypothetical protein
MTAVHPEPAHVDDEFVTEILARRRRRTPMLTLGLVVLVAAAAAFLLGLEAQKHWGTSSSSSGGAASARSAFAAAFANRSATSRTGGFTGARGATTGAPSFGGAAGGGATAGTVTLIKGSTLYVTDSTGNTVLVHTSPSSTVTKTVSGTVKSILPGDAVTVVGTQATNGSYTARAITVAAAGSSTNG